MKGNEKKIAPGGTASRRMAETAIGCMLTVLDLEHEIAPG
jgi:hypothetical protein